MAEKETRRNSGGRRAAGPAKIRWSAPSPLVALVWFVAAAVLLVDQLSKIWAVSALSGKERVALLGDAFGLVLLRNPGAAFSFATGQTWIFSIIAIAIIVVIVRVSHSLASTPWAIALGLVLGGALGNLGDRLFRAPGFGRGHVVDFLDYGGFFVGNIADIAIVVAAGMIVALSVMGLELDGTRAGAQQDETTTPAAEAAAAAGAEEATSSPSAPAPADGGAAEAAAVVEQNQPEEEQA